MIGMARLQNVRYCCEYVLSQNIPGDFIECGVWRGGTTIYMRAILNAWADTDRKVFVADSFYGLPKPNLELYPQDAGDPHHDIVELRISKDEVANNFTTHGWLDGRVVFLEGLVKDTLPTAPINKLSVLRIDLDMYEGYTQVFEHLYHKVSPGGFVIIDDYGLGPVKQAVVDFRSKNNITNPIITIDQTGVYWQI